MEKEYPVLFESKDKCCGCMACYAVCPKHTISIYTDEEGFEYPKVNTENCIKCYQCLKVCQYKQK